MALIHLTLLLLMQSVCMAFCDEAACTSSHNCLRPYIIILEAGFTGTRINVYRFQRTNSTSLRLPLLSEKRKGVKPELATLVNATNRIAEYLKPLLDFAKSVVPAESQSETSIFLGATSELRFFSSAQRRILLSKVADELRKTPFKTVYGGKPLKDDNLVLGVSGSGEGELAANAVNLLLGEKSNKYNLLYLGGSSVVISKNTKPKFRYTYTINYMGRSEATLGILGYWTKNLTSVYKSPCLNPKYTGMFRYGGIAIKVAGDGKNSSWDTCMAKVQDLFYSSEAHIKDKLAGPKFPYVTINAFFYVARTLSKLGHLTKSIPGNVTVQDFEDAAKKACINPPLVGRFAPYICLDGVFITKLLKARLMLDNNDQLFITNDIERFTPGWSLGLAWHFVKNPSIIGSF